MRLLNWFLHLLIVALLFMGGSYLHAQTTGFAPTLVQSRMFLTSSFTPSSPQTMSYYDPVTSGNLLVGCVEWLDNTGTTLSVTDTVGTTYSTSIVKTATGGASTDTKQCWYGSAAGSGANTVSVTFASLLRPTFHLTEFANISGTLDTSCSASANNTVTASLTTTCTTTINGDLMTVFGGQWAATNNIYANAPLQFAVGTGARNAASMYYEVAGVAGSHNDTLLQNSLLNPSQWSVITLAFKPAAIIVTTSALPDGAQTDPYHAFISCVGGAGAYTFSAVSGLPAWASISSSTGEITGTPNANATSSVQFRCTDGSTTANRTLNLTTGSAYVNSSLIQVASGQNSVTLPATATVGNLIKVVVSGPQTSGSVFEILPTSGTNNFISDTLGTVFHRLNPLTAVAGAGTLDNGAMTNVYVGIVGGCGLDTIKFTHTSTSGTILAVSEWAGLQGVVDDGTYVMLAGQSADPYSLTTPNYNALVANEILVNGVSASNPTNPFTLNSSFSTEVPYFVGSTVPLMTGYKSVSTTGNYTSNVTWTSGGSVISAMAVSLFGLRPALAPSACVVSVVPQLVKYRRRVW